MFRIPWVLAGTVALVGAGIVACSDPQSGSGGFEGAGPGYPNGSGTPFHHRDPATPNVGVSDASKSSPPDSSIPDAISSDGAGDAPEDVASDAVGDVAPGGDATGEAGSAGDASAD
jgi:hypothetical protein